MPAVGGELWLAVVGQGGACLSPCLGCVGNKCGPVVSPFIWGDRQSVSPRPQGLPSSGHAQALSLPRGPGSLKSACLGPRGFHDSRKAAAPALPGSDKGGLTGSLCPPHRDNFTVGAGQGGPRPSDVVEPCALGEGSSPTPAPLGVGAFCPRRPSCQGCFLKRGTSLGKPWGAGSGPACKPGLRAEPARA